jgi:MerR family transcriptional regulator, copper efflux regulator
MLISEFVRATGLTRDTVRFYVRLGLLHPKPVSKGGGRPYQDFNDDDVQAAKVVRVAKSLGLPLKEITRIRRERREGRLTPTRAISFLTEQLRVLEVKSAELKVMSAYLRAKIDWLKSGQKGSAPDFERTRSRTSRGNP